MSEQDLWCAVLEQAINDADLAYRTPDTKAIQNFPLPERRDAIAFIEAEHGPWARSRRDICSAAGIDPDAFRERCLKEKARCGSLTGMLVAKARPRKRGEIAPC